METKDHLYIARLITSEADLGGRLKNSAFEYGCISSHLYQGSYLFRYYFIR